MKKIEAIIRPSKLEDIKNELSNMHINGITINQVMGCGNQKGHKEFYRGMVVNINLIQKIKIEIVVDDNQVDRIIDLIVSNCRTGEVGDGKIFIYDVKEVI